MLALGSILKYAGGCPPREAEKGSVAILLAGKVGPDLAPYPAQPRIGPPLPPGSCPLPSASVVP